MSSPFKKPEFKELFQEWNAILQASGHQEIEDFNLPDPPLKVWHHLKWKINTTQDQMNCVRDYYEKARDLLFTFNFKSPSHRSVWILHCEGLSVRQIAEKLKRKKLSKTPVHMIIVDIERQSGLKRVKL